MRNKVSSRTTPEGLLEQYVEAIVQPDSVLDQLAPQTVAGLAAVIEAHRTPAARHDALVNVLGLLVTYIGIGVSGPRSLSGPLSASRQGEGMSARRTVLITEETEHGQVDYVLNDEILALMAQDPTQAFAHLVDATASRRDTDDDRSITEEEVCALVVAIFRIHGVPVPEAQA